MTSRTPHLGSHSKRRKHEEPSSRPQPSFPSPALSPCDPGGKNTQITPPGAESSALTVHPSVFYELKSKRAAEVPRAVHTRVSAVQWAVCILASSRPVRFSPATAGEGRGQGGAPRPTPPPPRPAPDASPAALPRAEGRRWQRCSEDRPWEQRGGICTLGVQHTPRASTQRSLLPSAASDLCPHRPPREASRAHHPPIGCQDSPPATASLEPPPHQVPA